MRRTTEQLIAEEGARVLPRTSLRKPIHAGNAWEHYEKAIEEARGLRKSSLLGEFLRTGNPDLGGEIKCILNNSSVLNHLERGARSDELEYFDRENRIREFPASAGRCSSLILAAFCDARLNFETGNCQGGVDRILDILQFGRDYAEGGVIENACGYDMAMRFCRSELEHSLNSGRLRPDSVAKLQSALDLLDAFPPSSEALVRRELANIGFAVYSLGLQAILEKWGLQDRKGVPGFRHLFSERRLAIEYFAFCKSVVRRSGGLDGWTSRNTRELLASLDRIPKVVQDFGHPLQVAFYFRSALADIRLLRMALHWQRTGECLPQTDPWGTQIHFEVTDKGLKAWSLGWNQRDDHGERGDIAIRIRR